MRTAAEGHLEYSMGPTREPRFRPVGMGLEPAAAQSLAGCVFRRRLVYYRLLPGWTRIFGAGKYTQLMYHEKPSEPCLTSRRNLRSTTPTEMSRI